MWDAGEKLLGENWGPGTPNPIERIESGLFSWGTDFDEQNNPFECRLGKWCDLDGDHDFLAKEALLRIREQGPREQLVGLHLAGSDPLPGAVKPMKLTRKDGSDIGTLRASTWSPQLERNIALARVLTAESELGNTILAEVADGSMVEATVVNVPFV